MKLKKIKQNDNISSNIPGKRKNRNRKYCRNHRKAQESWNSLLLYYDSKKPNKRLIKNKVPEFSRPRIMGSLLPGTYSEKYHISELLSLVKKETT